MKHTIERSAADWFRAAVEYYVAEHQGCPCCQQRHCVFRSFLGKRIEFFCSTCEFSACLDGSTGICRATPGSDQAATACVLDEVS